MHEVGVVMEIVETVETFAKRNQVTVIDTLVLQIGELSSMIPRYIEACFPAAVDGSILEHSKLEIELLPANGLCRACKKVFHIVEHNGICPVCNSSKMDILSGKEFMIKEIRCY